MIQKLKQTIQTTDNKLCDCKKKPNVITTLIEGELICKDCGVVFGYDEFHDMKNRIDAGHLSKTSLDIFQQRQIGTHPNDSRDVISTKNLKLEKNNSCIAEFSDVCKKLHLPNFIAEDAWRLFRRLKNNKKADDSFTRAKFVCIAVYQTCQNHSVPYDETMVQEIVQKSLHVKNAPKMQNIAFKESTQSTCGSSFSDRFSNEFSKKGFYLNLHVSQAQKERNILDVSQLKRLSFQYFDLDMKKRRGELNGNESRRRRRDSMITIIDQNSIAKRAVGKALLRYCAN